MDQIFTGNAACPSNWNYWEAFQGRPCGTRYSGVLREGMDSTNTREIVLQRCRISIMKDRSRFAGSSRGSVRTPGHIPSPSFGILRKESCEIEKKSAVVQTTIESRFTFLRDV